MVCRSLKQGHTSTAVNTDSAALTADTRSSSTGGTTASSIDEAVAGRA
ncbi:hypothetical protein HMPREF1980_01400 [Actinomyces sp. oral taxon 172 str. F0311]|nr:hypothetical protein HMPREF1980_01400 [Actinomyces sp. oral taxon 172 str. F0311]